MTELNESFLKKLSVQPAFCFTSDIDWAQESMIAETLSIFSGHDVPLTPFVTHDSETIRKHYGGDLVKYVGLHPNFRPDSSKGPFSEIISNAVNLWPEAKCFRSHSFVDSSLITKDFYQRGFRYDSNLCLHLQPGLVPLQEREGLVRFPVFLEDDVYFRREKLSGIAPIERLLKTPGLKVFNFHPVHICLNTPNIDFYNGAKENLNKDWKGLVYGGKGILTFLNELLKFVKSNPGLGTFYLDDLYSALTDLPPKKVPSADSSPGNTLKQQNSKLNNYEKADAEQRADYVRNLYDTLDGKEIYSTSRDFNLRELEINFIIDSIRKNLKGGKDPKILDIGCGNGYTGISIAKALKAEITGVDFSKEMIGGAKYLQEKFKDQLKGKLDFQVGDALKLDWGDGYFDMAVSERCLLNLPDEETQKNVIQDVHRVLRKGGIYVMVEGTRNGLRRLNDLRAKAGLEAIPDRSKQRNVSSLKFEEEQIDKFLSKYFKIINKHHFGMYYLISRIVHPLLVYPEQPKFDAKINEIARKIATNEPDYKKIGHVRGLVLEAI